MQNQRFRIPETPALQKTAVSQKRPKAFTLGEPSDLLQDLAVVAPKAYARQQWQMDEILKFSDDPERDAGKIQLARYLAERSSYSPSYTFQNTEKVLNEVAGYDLDLDVRKGLNYFFSTIKYTNEMNKAYAKFEDRGDEISKGSYTPEERTQLYKELRSDISKFQSSQPDIEKVKSWVSKDLVDGVGSTMPYMGSALAGNIAGGAVGYGVGAILAAAFPQISLPVILGTAALSKIGQKVGGMMATKPLLNAAGYVERLMLQNENGEYLDPELVNWGSELSSWVEAAVESVAIDAFAPWAGRIFRGSGASSLVNATIGGAVRNGLLVYGKGVLAETTEESLQSIVRDVTDNILKRIDQESEGRAWNYKDADKILSDAGKEFLRSLPTMAILGVGSAGISTGLNIGSIDRTVRNNANVHFTGDGIDVSRNSLGFTAQKYDAADMKQRLSQARKGKQKFEPVKAYKVGTVDGREYYHAVDSQDVISALEADGVNVFRIQEVERSDYVQPLDKSQYTAFEELAHTIAHEANATISVHKGTAALIFPTLTDLQKTKVSHVTRENVSSLHDYLTTSDQFGVHRLMVGTDSGRGEGLIEMMTEATYTVRELMYGKNLEQFISVYEEEHGKNKISRDLRMFLDLIYDQAHTSDNRYQAAAYAHELKPEILKKLQIIEQIQDVDPVVMSRTQRALSVKSKPNLKRSFRKLSPRESAAPVAEKEIWEKTFNEAVADGIPDEQANRVAGDVMKTTPKTKSSADDTEMKTASDQIAELDAKYGTTTNIVTSGKAFPQAVKDEIRKTGKDPDSIQGVVYDGVVYINVNASVDPVKTWAHEWIAHRGLADLFGEDMKGFMLKVWESQGKDVIQEKIDEFYHHDPEHIQAEEYLAKLAEEYERNGEISAGERTLLQRLMDLIKRILRSLGVVVKFSDRELMKILADAKKALGKVGVIDSKTRLQVSAWHGSPHEFGRFSTDRIGSGEGHQAFGWGLYFTDIEGIARDYAKTLGRQQKPSVKLNGKELDEDEVLSISESAGRIEMDRLTALAPAVSADYFAEDLEREILDWLSGDSSIPDWFEAYLAERDDIEVTYRDGSRNLYKTTLHAGKDPSEYEFLQWRGAVSESVFDKIEAEAEKESLDLGDRAIVKEIEAIVTKYGSMEKLNEQYRHVPVGEVVRDHMAVHNLSLKAGIYTVYNGASLYENLKWRLDPWLSPYIKTSKKDMEASLFLLRAGIDGIRYPAQSGGFGDGSKGWNYVVFDDQAVTIDEHIRFQVTPDSYDPQEAYTIDGITYDNRNGAGATPNQQTANYFGFTVTMRADTYLALAADMGDLQREDILDIVDGPIAAPFLTVVWDAERKVWETVSHEGRHRVSSIARQAGRGAEILVNIMPNGMRARDITPEMAMADIESESVGSHIGGYGYGAVYLDGEKIQNSIIGIQKKSLDSYNQNIRFQILSSRLPSAVSASEDPLNEILTISYDVIRKDTKTLTKNLDALFQSVNMRKVRKNASTTTRAEQFIDHVVKNLLFLHDHMPEEMRMRAKLWYDGGRKTIEKWANRYGISEMQGAALIAVLSPQNGWYQNMTQAERIADILFTQREFRWDDAMTLTANTMYENDSSRSKETSKKKMDQAVGKTLGELLGDLELAARWVRVFDQTYNDRSYKILTPEGGSLDYATIKSGENATHAWKAYGAIAKGISVLLDGRAENVYYQIGTQHKVRNFYNNLFAPESTLGFTTIDTHAVAAALMRPLAASSVEVGQAFGTGGSSSAVSGLNGTYPLYLEAYRRAAEARGILPREMQSITWEGIRGVFEAAKKNGLKKEANAIWERYQKKEIEQDQAQQEILDLAEGLTPPDWSTEAFTDEITHTYAGKSQESIDALPENINELSDMETKVFYEVAPDPNDTALTEEWNALDEEAKLEISKIVANTMIPKVLAEVGVAGEMEYQFGGYEGVTNPSMALLIDRDELLVTTAKLLGFTLSQDSMMVVSGKHVLGTDPTGVVSIGLPEGYGAAEIDSLYQRLWEIEKDGEKLVTGHTTAGNFMSILNYSSVDTRELASIINTYLNNEFRVHKGDIFSAFIDNEEYQYASDRRTSKGSSVQNRSDNLRSEATEILREELDKRKENTTRFQIVEESVRKQHKDALNSVSAEESAVKKLITQGYPIPTELLQKYNDTWVCT